jgi:hypothetical protein
MNTQETKNINYTPIPESSPFFKAPKHKLTPKEKQEDKNWLARTSKFVAE